MRKRAAVLISGRGSNMAALIKAARDASYPAEIVLVASNNPDAGGLSQARAAGIEAVVLDHRPFGPDREAFERELHGVLAGKAIDMICLAGFMRLLTPWFTSLWRERIINIHPALLPAFRGLDTHRRALAAGVKIHGATVHFVVPEVDAGPIIAQAAVPVLAGDTVQALADRVLALEHQIYPLALSLLADGRLRVVDGRCEIAGTISFAGSLIVPKLGRD